MSIIIDDESQLNGRMWWMEDHLGWTVVLSQE
jgi:hypothetical protein